jgi:sugar-specific transcriptional regulator TrmB
LGSFSPKFSPAKAPANLASIVNEKQIHEKVPSMPLENEEEKVVLFDLGLNMSQAKVFLALFRLQNPHARAVSKFLNLARQDVYRIISELSELGLVEKLLTKPNTFRPVPMQNAVSVLMQRKLKEKDELQERAARLVCSYENMNIHKRTECEVFFEVYKMSLNDWHIIEAIRNTREEIRFVTKWAIFAPVMYAYLDEHLKAMKRGVKFNVVTETPVHLETQPKYMESVEKNPSFHIKYLPTSPNAGMLVFDNKVMALSNITEKLDSSVTLWSNHPGLIELGRSYFESAWKAASEK